MKFRSSITGAYVTEEFAALHPDTTVSEADFSPGDELLFAQHEALITEVKEYLDEFYKADEEGERISWPDRLAQAVDWKAPE